MYCKHHYYVLRFLCKVNYDSNKFIHVPTYSYNEAMRLLELAGVVFNRMFENLNKWHVLVWISIIKTNNELSIYGNKLHWFFFNHNASTLYSKNMNANFRKYYLIPCLITKFGIIAHVILLIAHVLPLTAHCSRLIAHVLASFYCMISCMTLLQNIMQNTM
jgi:hypothetical protein